MEATSGSTRWSRTTASQLSQPHRRKPIQPGSSQRRSWRRVNGGNLRPCSVETYHDAASPNLGSHTTPVESRRCTRSYKTEPTWLRQPRVRSNYGFYARNRYLAVYDDHGGDRGRG